MIREHDDEQMLYKIKITKIDTASKKIYGMCFGSGNDEYELLMRDLPTVIKDMSFFATELSVIPRSQILRGRFCNWLDKANRETKEVTKSLPRDFLTDELRAKYEAPQHAIDERQAQIIGQTMLNTLRKDVSVSAINMSLAIQVARAFLVLFEDSAERFPIILDRITTDLKDCCECCCKATRAKNGIYVEEYVNDGSRIKNGICTLHDQSIDPDEPIMTKFLCAACFLKAADNTDEDDDE